MNPSREVIESYLNNQSAKWFAGLIFDHTIWNTFISLHCAFVLKGGLHDKVVIDGGLTALKKLAQTTFHKGYGYDRPAATNKI